MKRELHDRLFLMSSSGGHARARKLSRRRRQQIAQKAARARWGKAKEGK